ncbi:MAG: peptide chain release factor N(5)-glutamine methyltransferase [Deltaproteobacteria bacterium HGW-Deltaproteobacteria-4]|nr:MAG: peptide chain release factor N(5)-glutamine methyltransferase [Deltaproteobacteria bacterium HGW-Deltaproteobacteria-4]
MREAWTVLDLLKWTASYFAGKGIENGRLDAELLLAEILKLNRIGLYLNFDRPVNSDELAVFRALIERRARREPIAYILGRCEFWSLTFKVGPEVLIPRGDTETLVEAALKVLPPGGTLLDVGVGSGAIALAIAHDRPDVQVEGIDLSPAALALATENAQNLGLTARVTLRQGDLFTLDDSRQYDVIVSNPPYIAIGEKATLMPEVRDFEPALALFAGEDGLDCYRALIPAARGALKSSGILFVEVGAGQAEAVAELFAIAGYVEIFTNRDLAGIDRVVAGRKASGCISPNM